MPEKNEDSFLVILFGLAGQVRPYVLISSGIHRFLVIFRAQVPEGIVLRVLPRITGTRTPQLGVPAATFPFCFCHPHSHPAKTIVHSCFGK